MDPLAAGSGAFATKDGVEAGGPITSPVSCIADVERNEQAVPLFYLHRKLTPDTGGAGKYRGGLSGEVALTLGGIEKAMALVMTHGAESPNTAGLAGGWPGSTVVQSMGWGAIDGGLPNDHGKWERFGPKPGLMPMTNRDVFSVIWQGGGGWGDPLEREVSAVAADVLAGAVSAETAREIYGVVVTSGAVDDGETERQREALRKARVGNFDIDPSKKCAAQPIASLSEGLFIAQDDRGTHVTSRAGYILATNNTAWRNGAKSVTFDKLPERFRIDLHADLCCTVHYCPASGAQLAVDFHRKGEPPADDLLLDIASLPRLAA
jgi:N-methylhydantoinase B